MNVGHNRLRLRSHRQRGPHWQDIPRLEPVEGLQARIQALEGGTVHQNVKREHLEKECLSYRETHLLVNLGWVDFDLGCSAILPSYTANSAKPHMPRQNQVPLACLGSS